MLKSCMIFAEDVQSNCETPPESPSYDLPRESFEEQVSADSESHSRALRLIVRLGQPFHAFLIRPSTHTRTTQDLHSQWMNSMSTLAPTSRTLQMQLHGGMGTARLIRICRELSYYPRYFYTTSTSEVHPNSEPRQQRLLMFDLDCSTNSRKRYLKSHWCSHGQCPASSIYCTPLAVSAMHHISCHRSQMVDSSGDGQPFCAFVLVQQQELRQNTISLHKSKTWLLFLTWWTLQH